MLRERLPEDLGRCEAALARRGRPARVVPRTGSTNDDARAWAREGGATGAVIIADAQESGRGRQGRSWSTPPGETLAMSVILRPRVAPTDLPPIALVAGLAARSAIADRVPFPVRLKWPNDVVIDRKKIAGILVEGAIAGAGVEHVVVGIGINVRRASFPPELIATSLALEGATDLDRGTLALAVLDALDAELAAWLGDPGAIGKRLQPHDALVGRSVVLENGVSGVADGIADDGRLRVRVDDRVLFAHAGEVRIQ